MEHAALKLVTATSSVFSQQGKFNCADILYTVSHESIRTPRNEKFEA